MPDITVSIPNVGMQAYFTFKDPVSYYIRNKFNLNTTAIKLKVISVISMKDTIRNDLRDPFTDLYSPAGISEVDYKQDLIDNVPVVSFSFRDSEGIERYVRSPLNYIERISSVSSIEYMNKLIVIDLNRLPKEVDTTLFFEDLKDFVMQRLGVVSEIKEVSVGETEMVDHTEHTTRETIRKNTATVHKTLQTQLQEAQLRSDQILLRLQELGITLD